jgi:hypothetical protein
MTAVSGWQEWMRKRQYDNNKNGISGVKKTKAEKIEK